MRIESLNDFYKNNEPEMFEDIIIEEIMNPLKSIDWNSPGID